MRTGFNNPMWNEIDKYDYFLNIGNFKISIKVSKH